MMITIVPWPSGRTYMVAPVFVERKEEIVEDTDWPPLTDEDKVVIRRHAKRIESWTDDLDGSLASKVRIKGRIHENTEVDRLHVYDVAVRLRGRAGEVSARLRALGPDALIGEIRPVDHDGRTQGPRLR